MATYETEIVIDAPPAAVWKHLIDVGRHDEWSQHFQLRGQPIVGGPGRIEFALFGVSTGANVVFQKVDEPRELRWHGGPKGLAYGSHFFILEPLDGGTRTRFRHGESFSGLLAPLVVRLLGSNLGGPSYEGFNEDLRRRVLEQ
ncbi:MAG: SRPBCC domain-containing protein [Polyangiales bacterium]